MNTVLSQARHVSLVETLDVALTKGVVLAGDITISLADVDLIFVGLRVLLASVETSEKMRLGYSDHKAPLTPPFHPYPPDAGVTPCARRGGSSTKEAVGGGGDIPGDPCCHVHTVLPPLDAHPARIEKGLGRLVLALIDIIRRVLEKQAIRRIDGNSLSEGQIENLGEALMKLEDKMDELRGVFGLEEEDLDLNLGPLGNLK